MKSGVVSADHRIRRRISFKGPGEPYHRIRVECDIRIEEREPVAGSRPGSAIPCRGAALPDLGANQGCPELFGDSAYDGCLRRPIVGDQQFIILEGGCADAPQTSGEKFRLTENGDYD